MARGGQLWDCLVLAVKTQALHHTPGSLEVIRRVEREKIYSIIWEERNMGELFETMAKELIAGNEAEVKS